MISLLQFNVKQLKRSQHKSVEVSLQIFKSISCTKLQYYRNTIEYNKIVFVYKQNKAIEKIP
eukprot:snap_masked-scaffold_1-processed-gene-19.39-mRNA-1 protein AED:1.00 eAED:1.00 QI:0/-1/0/0/-1/1/1/0/61